MEGYVKALVIQSVALVAVMELQRAAKSLLQCRTAAWKYTHVIFHVSLELDSEIKASKNLRKDIPPWCVRVM